MSLPNLFAGSEYLAGPKADEFELVLFGPGYGEAVAAHIGDGKWILIDSCRFPKQPEPVSLQYLEDISVSASDVVAVIATHWDNDHIAGLASVMKRCTNAKFCMSGALGQDDFIAYVKAYNEPFPGKTKSGVEEIAEVLNEIHTSGRRVRRVDQSTRIFGPEDIPLSKCDNFELWSLSPAQFEQDNFLMWAASQFPSTATIETRRVAVRRIRNDLSVALHLTVGDVVVLLGADLEEEGNPETGWSAVLSASGRPRALANLFKIPHHGSSTAHHADVWDQMLATSPFAIVAPWTVGKAMLPTMDDVGRLQGNTPNLFLTAAIAGSKPKARSATVEKMIRASAKSLVSARRVPGMIRVRSPIGAAANFKVELFGAASAL